MSKKIPNPGSDAALKMGCSCPVLDNNRGRGIGSNAFLFNSDCGIHGNDEARKNYIPKLEWDSICMALADAGRRSPGFRQWAWVQGDTALEDWIDDKYIAGCLCLLAGFK